LKRDERPAELPPYASGDQRPRALPCGYKPSDHQHRSSTKDCNISVSKQQFDNLVKSFNTNNQAVTPAQRRGLGEKYVELLVFSEAAKAAGIENTPTYVEVMRVLRLKNTGRPFISTNWPKSTATRRSRKL